MVNFHGKSSWFITMDLCHELLRRNFEKFPPKFFFSFKIIFFAPKFRSFSTISIFYQNAYFGQKNHFWPKMSILDKNFVFFNFRSFFSENIFFDYRNEIYAIDYPRKFEKMVKIVHRKKKLRLAENVLAASM